MGGINQTLIEKIKTKYGDSPEAELAIQALELAEQYGDEPDVIKRKLDAVIKNLSKNAEKKGDSL